MQTSAFNCPKCGQKIVTRFLKAGEVAKCGQCGASATMPSPQGAFPEAGIAAGTDVWQLFISKSSPMLEERLNQIAECNPNLLLDFLAQDWVAAKARFSERRGSSAYSPIFFPRSTLLSEQLLRAVQMNVLKAAPKERSPKFIQTMAHLIKSPGGTPVVCSEVRLMAVDALVELGEYAVLDKLQQLSSLDEMRLYIRRVLANKGGFTQVTAGDIVDTLCSPDRPLSETSVKWLELCVQDSDYLEDLLSRMGDRRIRLLDGLSKLNTSASKQLLGMLTKDFISQTRLGLKVGVFVTAPGILGVIWLVWSVAVKHARLDGWGVLLSGVFLLLGLGSIVQSAGRLRRAKKYIAHASEG